LIEEVVFNPPTELEVLAEEVIRRILAAPDLPVSEGTVMSLGPPPYRRIDCCGRALVYVRVRPRKSAVRVDLSGLWEVVAECALRVPGATGSASLLVREAREIDELIAFLRAAVNRTRTKRRFGLLPTGT